MAHITTNAYGAGYTQIGGGLSTCTNSVDTGSGSNRIIIVTHYRRIDRAIAIQSVTIGGVSMDVLGSDQLVTGNYYCRTFVLVNPAISGTQSLVITTTTNGSNSVGDTVVGVYDNVDPTASPSSLLVIDDTQTILTPWTGSVSITVPSELGNQVVATLFGVSSDVSYNLTESGTTERFLNVTGGISKYTGDADGDDNVVCEWALSNLNQDGAFAVFGFDLPPPGSPPSTTFAVRQYANGTFHASEFVEMNSGPAMRIGSNVTVQSYEFNEDAGRTTHQLNILGEYHCAEIVET